MLGTKAGRDEGRHFLRGCGDDGGETKYSSRATAAGGFLILSMNRSELVFLTLPDGMGRLISTFTNISPSLADRNGEEGRTGEGGGGGGRRVGEEPR